jgi:microcystin-dependent protein
MDNLFVGQILLLPYNFSPVNLAPCDGQLLPMNQNMALFSLLGTNFGGDGQKTFALPNYQGLAPKGSQYFIVLNGVFPSRQS